MKKKFYVADDIVDMLNISKTTAYRIIHKLNEELKANGYITIAGRVPKTFFDKRFYSEEVNETEGIPAQLPCSDIAY